MPFFKTTKNILKNVDEDELHEDNNFDRPFIYLPDSKKWDYKRELKVEDVDIWEVLYEDGSGKGVYASWLPYAEFYLIKIGFDTRNIWEIEKNVNGKKFFSSHCDFFYETYYGKGSQDMVIKRSIDLGIILNINKVWVEEESLWLYE